MDSSWFYSAFIFYSIFYLVYWELSHIHIFCVWSQQINISLKLFHPPLPVLPHYPSQLVCRCCCSRASLWPRSWPAGSVPKGRAVWHYYPSSRSGLLLPQVDLFMATFSAICIQTLGIKNVFLQLNLQLFLSLYDHIQKLSFFHRNSKRVKLYAVWMKTSKD